MSIKLNYFKEMFFEMLKNYQQDNDEIRLTKISKGDEVDLVNDNREKMLFLKLQGRQKFFVKKIKQAIERIDEGSFGICSICGEDIEEKRLSARPMTSLCIGCKEEQEREECHVLYHRKSHTLGKTFGNNVVSLKS